MGKACHEICARRIEAKSRVRRSAAGDGNGEIREDGYQQHRRVSPLAWILLLVIRIYQHTLSHLIGGSCRHQPTCSRYGAEAIRKYGAIKGGWMTFKRVCRCHPWGTSGYDPVE